MNLKKILILPIGFMLSILGCAGLGPQSTYYFSTTSFLYDISYNSYNVELNGQGLGGGFGRARTTTKVKTGYQELTWRDAQTGEIHRAKNQIVITKEQLKGKKYLAAHIYPDNTVEITTSMDIPEPTEKGMKLRSELKRKIYNN